MVCLFTFGWFLWHMDPSNRIEKWSWGAFGKAMGFRLLSFWLKENAVVVRDQEVCEATATLKLRYHVPRIKKKTLYFAICFLNKASKSITLTWHSAVMAVVPVDFHPLVPVHTADSFLAPTSVSEKLTSDPVRVPGCSLIFQIWYLTLFEMVFGDVGCL